MATLTIRIDENLKNQAETVFKQVGLSTSSAINIFFKQVVRTSSIPFDLIAEIPNKETLEAFEEGDKKVLDGDKGYQDMESFKKALKWVISQSILLISSKNRNWSAETLLFHMWLLIFKLIFDFSFITRVLFYSAQKLN